MERKQLSQSFLWGAATSAHQVEGYNIHNDWWDWEHSAGVTKSGAAADQYNRYAEDFALAKSLGHNAHRLSLEWSRLELERGEWNHKAIQHYRDVLKELRKNGLTSFVTLHHFTNPLWLTRIGGWLNPHAPQLFARYAAMAAEQFGDLVDYWVTINEPGIYAYHGYWTKKWPPNKQSTRGYLKALRYMAQAHCLAYEAIHKRLPHAQVGLAHNAVAYLPHNPSSWADRTVSRVLDWWTNERLFNTTRGTHDFIGLNYYFTNEIKVNWWPFKITRVPWQGAHSDLGWAIRPEGLTHELLQFKKYNLPIFITENGIADAEDKQRAEFIRSHLRAVEAAQVKGAHVKGYLHWSLIDNFEWADGFSPRFGLIEIDYKTLERKPRHSAYVLKAIIEQASN